MQIPAVGKITSGSNFGSSGDANDRKLRQTCKDMESIFLHMMLREMRKTVPKDSLLGESNADAVFRDLYDGEMAKGMAQAGGIGLAEILYRQLSPEVKVKSSQAPK